MAQGAAVLLMPVRRVSHPVIFDHLSKCVETYRLFEVVLDF